MTCNNCVQAENCNMVSRRLYDQCIAQLKTKLSIFYETTGIPENIIFGLLYTDLYAGTKPSHGKQINMQN